MNLNTTIKQNLVVNETPLQLQNPPTKRGYRFYIKRGLPWFGIALVALVVLGVSYQTVASVIDRRIYTPRGQLYTVNGRQMHMVCMGAGREGDPTVILQAGGANTSLWWLRVQNQLAQQRRVCAYDRAGLGWSEAADAPRDPLTIVGELHELLAVADIQPPYVMTGHSYGALLTRIYAAQHPTEVAGIVLVDGMPLELKTLSQSEFAQYRTVFYAAQVPMWLLYRLGVVRLIGAGMIEALGYPAEIVPEMAALTTSNQTVDTDFAEKGFVGMWPLMQAALAAEELGNLPTAVLWAERSGTNQPSYAAYRQEVAGYSSNRVTRTVQGADHGSILGNEQYAQQVSNAILAVIGAAQTGEPLARQQ
jgi:pimeloyl-ACP methyl ester carboxylesterase